MHNNKMMTRDAETFHEEKSKPSYNILEEIDIPIRLVQCIQCHNEESLIKSALRSIYNEVDEILVIEGATINRPNRTEDGHSTDQTIERIMEFIREEDADNKVQFIQRSRPFIDLEEIKNTFLRYLRDGDIVFINDADEYYLPEDVRRIRHLACIYPLAREFVPMFLHFYRDLYHIKKPDAEHQVQHQRIFKYYKGMYYASHPVIAYPNGVCSYFHTSVQQFRYILRDMYIWHLGFIKDPEEQRRKAEFYKQELAKHGDRGVDAHLEKTEVFLNYTEDLSTIAKYTGDHPQVLKDHDLYAYKEKFYEDKQFDNWIEVEPYNLDPVPQIYALTKSGQRGSSSNQVGQKWRINESV
jgi:hypothetical protein